MDIVVEDMTNSAYSNFVESIKSKETRRDLTYNNATVSLSPYILTEQSVATYPSQKGDSGGPIFINHKNGTATMLGIMAGGACVIDVDGNHLSVRNEYNNCMEVFKIFSPWPNIANDLNIS